MRRPHRPPLLALAPGALLALACATAPSLGPGPADDPSAAAPPALPGSGPAAAPGDAPPREHLVGAGVPRAPTSGPAASAMRGMDAAAVRQRLGEPGRVVRFSSATARGVGYESWSYGNREVVLVDGKVIDVLDASP